MHKFSLNISHCSDDSDEDLDTLRESMMSLLQQSDPRSDDELNTQQTKTKKKTKKVAKKGKKVKKKKKVWYWNVVYLNFSSYSIIVIKSHICREEQDYALSTDLNIFYSEEMDWAWHWTRRSPLQSILCVLPRTGLGMFIHKSHCIGVAIDVCKFEFHWL